MSRSVSTLTLAILLFCTFFTIFTSAAPTDATCGGPQVKSSPGKVENVPAVPENPSGVDNFTNSTNSTVVDDGGAVDPDNVNTLAATRSGTATWFNVGLGACGYQNVDSDFIVALAQPDWGQGSHCNQKVQITNPKNERTRTAIVRDLCPGCPSGNLDMSPSLFTSLADDLGLGVFHMTWKYV
ncbi:hypothetical protein BDM02DRAFT_3127312 [Thelephora ganbajun]|uniref:Uncharacterized protein n=1 Tax=Thelephora ganbajun TaxID=370292 RepID=A0ACB6ZMD6_THEGA|nr:hypothetical protein BDM02DRAFT_3127312 [Thelephora ganbajun]